MWLDDGIEYIYAQSESMDDDELFGDGVTYGSENEDMNLDDGEPWGLTQVEAEMY